MYTINGAAMKSREEAHEELARALEFPKYYGGNLDALWDMVTSMRGEVVLADTPAMLNALEGYGCRLLDLLYKAAKQNPHFTFRAE